MKEKLKWLKFRISFNWSGFLQHMLNSVSSRTLQLISLLFVYAGSYLWLFFYRTARYFLPKIKRRLSRLLRNNPARQMVCSQNGLFQETIWKVAARNCLEKQSKKTKTYLAGDWINHLFNTDDHRACHPVWGFGLDISCFTLLMISSCVMCDLRLPVFCFPALFLLTCLTATSLVLPWFWCFPLIISSFTSLLFRHVLVCLGCVQVQSLDRSLSICLFVSPCLLCPRVFLICSSWFSVVFSLNFSLPFFCLWISHRTSAHSCSLHVGPILNCETGLSVLFS